jgi:pimeloyl-ACP methyl ester carboxylesterase
MLLSDASAAFRGKRPVLLCLHCSGGSGRQWRALTGPLADRFDVRTPDLLGYALPGRWPSGLPVSLDEEVAHVMAAIADTDAPVHLLGHSYGGAVAMQVALRHPDRIASMTLYEPVRFGLLFGDHAGDDRAQETEAAHQEIVSAGHRFGMIAMSGRHELAAELFTGYWAGPTAWQRMDDRRRRLQATLMPKVHAEYQAVFADRVAPAAWSALDLPVRLIGGTQSPLPARAVMRQLARRLPRVTTVTIAGADHMGPITEPEQVRACLPFWLRPLPQQREAAAADALLAA